MALRTLKDVEKIGGFPVVVMDELKDRYPEKFTHTDEKGNVTSQMDYKWFESEIRPFNFVYVRHDVNSISFTLQNGPIAEVKKQREREAYTRHLIGLGYAPEDAAEVAEEDQDQNIAQYQEFIASCPPISGVNGCQFETLIHTGLLMLKKLNSEVLCREKSIAITKFEEGLMWLEKRKQDRIARNVEGTHNA